MCQAREQIESKAINDYRVNSNRLRIILTRRKKNKTKQKKTNKKHARAIDRQEQRVQPEPRLLELNKKNLLNNVLHISVKRVTEG